MAAARQTSALMAREVLVVAAMHAGVGCICVDYSLTITYPAPSNTNVHYVMLRYNIRAVTSTRPTQGTAPRTPWLPLQTAWCPLLASPT